MVRPGQPRVAVENLNQDEVNWDVRGQIFRVLDVAILLESVFFLRGGIRIKQEIESSKIFYYKIGFKINIYL